MSTPDFVGRGWARGPAAAAAPEPPPLPLLTPDGATSIRESLELVLATAPGERVMRPDFGCAVHDLVFAPNDAATAGAAAHAVREAVVLWEPRVEVEDVVVTASAPDTLLIEVRYRVRATNSRDNLVYPFALA